MNQHRDDGEEEEAELVPLGEEDEVVDEIKAFGEVEEKEDDKGEESPHNVNQVNTSSIFTLNKLMVS